MKTVRFLESSGVHEGRRLVPAGLLCLVMLVFGFCGNARGYIMPAEQIIGFMAENFSKFETVTMIQDIEGAEAEKTVRQRVWLKSPDYFRADTEGEGLREDEDRPYWRLLIANHERRLSYLLTGLGVNLEAVSFTRIDGIVAYRIGNREPGSPQLIVEKERFLPLALHYREPGGAEDALISVRFSDYRKLEQGWYPFGMTLSSGGEVSRKFTLQDLQVNVPVDSSVFYPTGEQAAPDRDPGGDQGGTEEDRLKKIIEAFEERYR